ncbi:glycosyltransferase [Streptomyces profundus]|uniref:glycosyltransferase n=1 Tax=Streptomyces profundus TaxID=2867410 RepID=UPI001D16C6C6|nr:glycosyltransferase [Streptomyces sp. MA3_2.13]UED85372.1 glycosyltransferase [Streptomyces sp. MA3_2.13]
MRYEPPRADHAAPGRHAALAAIALVALAVWGTWHLVGVITWSDGAPPLALIWLASFSLAWWLPLCWWERPIGVSRAQRHGVDRLRVTVQIPVYNEDPHALRLCLDSALDQSRRVERIAVVNDGSVDVTTGEPITYRAERAHLERRAGPLGIEVRWEHTVNQGKRWAQMRVLAEDDADIFVTLDSDSVLDRHAVREGLKPFADPRVRSVAGLVTVLNTRRNALTMLTSMLYLPFTRGLRSAQSVLGSVLINSGTLAFYRADVVRAHAGVYERERFRGVPIQLNDDSMLTMYARLDGRTVHQPSAIVFTLVPERPAHYVNQQLRWMRGTTVRHLWWLRHMPLRSLGFWMPVVEYTHLLLGLLLPVMVVADPWARANLTGIMLHALVIGCAINYLVALRRFSVRRLDEPRSVSLTLFALSPLAGLWRLLVLRPLYLYALATCWHINAWGTRQRVEVTAEPMADTRPPSDQATTRGDAVPGRASAG